MWDELGIDPTDDPKAIRRAYAARLKTLDPDRDLQAFMRLRTMLEQALASAAHIAPMMHAADTEDDARASEPHDADAFERAIEAEADAPSTSDVAAGSDLPTRTTEPLTDWTAANAGDLALLDELDQALIDCDAPKTVKLYYRAAATGVVPLRGETRLLDRVLGLAVDDKTMGDTAFEEFVGAFGCDQPSLAVEQSEIHQRVRARLAASKWYETMLAAAEWRNGATRKQARLGRLMLGRIGRYRMPRVDREVLKRSLADYHAHEHWLRDRIDPAWVRRLEARLRRREIAGSVFLMLFLGGMLINGLVQVAMEAIFGEFSIVTILMALVFVAFLGWFVSLLGKSLLRLLREAPKVSNQAPPEEDQEVRLRWLEQQAEAAYDAMYDARAGSSVTAHYSDAKEFLYDAISLARRLGKAETAERLSQRLAHIKAVFRSQFS